MTGALPARPDLGHLRRDAKQLLAHLRAHHPQALARVQAHAPDLPATLSTAQLVIARELGFASWAQLKVLVNGMAVGGVRYDEIGRGYCAYRRSDPRIAAVIDTALGDARTVINVGAGAGSYEPSDRRVVPVEPSTAMALQRDPGLTPAVLGVAESLPFPDGVADAAMAILTMHHWADIRRGLSEMRRVARQRIVLVTIDVDVEAEMWLLRDYLPEIVQRDRHEFPTMNDLTEAFAGSVTITPIPVAADCQDGFLLAFWNRPEAVLDPDARMATSGFARLDTDIAAAAVRRLETDLHDGTWDDRYGSLRQLEQLEQLDVGLRLVVSEIPGGSGG